MQVLGVVLHAEAFEQHAGVLEAPELVLVQAFVAQPAVERLGEAVLPRLARRDVERLGAGLPEPVDDLGAMNSPPLSDLITADAPWTAKSSPRTAFTAP